MRHYSEFTPTKGQPYVKKDVLYQDVIFTLDTEVSSIYDHPDTGWGQFDYYADPEYYQNVEKASILYIWMMSVDGERYYGRELSELGDFIDTLNEAYPGRKICYVHNLGYDFEFISQVVPFPSQDSSSVFARKAHAPIFARSLATDFEFRCSYMLTNCSLEKAGENYGSPVEKMVGDLDYTIVRTPKTELTEKEMGYCEHDVWVLHHVIEHFKEQYGHLVNIPYTSTSIVRKQLAKILKYDRSYMNKLRTMLPTIDEFMMLRDAFAGGYTAANPMHTGHILRNVKSFDFRSDYPHMMCVKKFPMSRFRECAISRYQDLNPDKCYLLKVRFHNISSKIDWSYISESKAYVSKDSMISNGRVYASPMVEMTMTEQDLHIIMHNYDMESYEFLEVYEADQAYLPKKFVEFILKHYANKTLLKGLDDKKAEYMMAKAVINGLYGMCVTNNVRPGVSMMSDGTWIEDDFDSEIEAEMILESNKTAFLSYAWGVWVTAYARREIWKVLGDTDNGVSLGHDAVYVDTDSVKLVGDHDDYFRRFDEQTINEIKQVCAERGLDYEQFAPKTSKGVPQILGTFDNDACYDRFITWGAKKYCDESHNKLEITVSGLNKKDAPTALRSIEDFAPGQKWNYDTSGRTCHFYTIQRDGIRTVDYQGNSYTIHQKRGIVIMPTTYKLGISSTYNEFLTAIGNRTHNKLLSNY